MHIGLTWVIPLAQAPRIHVVALVSVGPVEIRETIFRVWNGRGSSGRWLFLSSALLQGHEFR